MLCENLFVCQSEDGSSERKAGWEACEMNQQQRDGWAGRGQGRYGDIRNPFSSDVLGNSAKTIAERRGARRGRPRRQMGEGKMQLWGGKNSLKNGRRDQRSSVICRPQGRAVYTGTMGCKYRESMLCSWQAWLIENIPINSGPSTAPIIDFRLPLTNTSNSLKWHRFLHQSTQSGAFTVTFADQSNEMPTSCL